MNGTIKRVFHRAVPQPPKARQEPLVEQAYHNSPPLFSVLGIIDVALVSSMKLQYLLGKLLPRLNRHRVKPGIYRGWYLGLDGRAIDIDTYLAVISLGNRTNVIRLTKDNDDNYVREGSSVVINKPTSEIFINDLSRFGFYDRPMTFTKISSLTDFEIDTF